jgi:hypothetical protein
MFALWAVKACCSSIGMACWSIDTDRGFPPSFNDPMITLVIFVPVTSTFTERIPN